MQAGTPLVIFAFDPGSWTGWSLSRFVPIPTDARGQRVAPFGERWRLLAHGTTHHDNGEEDAGRVIGDVVEWIETYMPDPPLSPDVVTVEKPIVPAAPGQGPGKAGGRGRMASGGAAASALSVAQRGGYLRGATWERWRPWLTWGPTAARWRPFVGFPARARRDSVNPQIFTWALRIVQEQGTRPNVPAELTLHRKHREKGARLYDEANAIALNMATAVALDRGAREDFKEQRA